LALAFASAGSKIEDNTAITPMTTSSSIKVKPGPSGLGEVSAVLWNKSFTPDELSREEPHCNLHFAVSPAHHAPETGQFMNASLSWVYLKERTGARGATRSANLAKKLALSWRCRRAWRYPV
jgi:hypothetical protein